ncbi:MAG TPA: acyl-CoA synthetase [Acidimicrobiales bacterium]|nr:acyl-CoA synthetase [Acidimicrobiales bacterium]
MTTFNLADLFEAVADAVPDREAIVCDGRRLTFAELDDRATRLAHVLPTLGVGPGDHVGLHLFNGNEYLEAMLACFKLRAVPVNMNYRYVADELRYLFADADLVAVLSEPALRAVLDGADTTVPRLERGVPYEEAVAAASSERDFEDRSGDDLYILYTGGTTGVPKGVMWRQEDLFFAALGGGNPGGPPVGSPFEVAERAQSGFHRCLTAPPFMHGAAHWMALQVLLAGGCVVIDRDPGLVPERVWQLADAERVAFLVVVGDAFARPLADALEAAGPDRWPLDALTAVLSGGAILSPTVKDDLLRLLPHVLVVDGFGASETGGQGQVVSAAGIRSPARTAGPVRFTPNDDSTAVLGDGLRPVEPGSGELGWVARRGHIPLGYYKDPEKTAAVFPVVDGVRWAVPGDRACVEADGSVTVLGRGSTSINTGGEKVYPEEVEAALKAHPAVFDALVVGVPDRRWGERVVAVVAPRPGAAPPDVDELAALCRESLAAYKAPRQVVPVESIVRSPSGKPDYRWAREVAGNSPASGGGDE